MTKLPPASPIPLSAQIADAGLQTDAMIPAWVDGALRPMDKIEVHRQGLRHPAISVFVLAGDRLLLQQRAMTKYHTPGLWTNTCCTHPHWGESPVHCAIRRLREELGISGLLPVHRGRIAYRADVGGGMIEDEEVDLFVAETAPVLPVSPDPSEVMALRWITAQDLARDLVEQPDAFTPWLRIYLAEHGLQIWDQGRASASDSRPRPGRQMVEPS